MTHFKNDTRTEDQRLTDECIVRDRQRRHELAWALISRVLTDAEMGEVGAYGSGLFIENMVPFNQVEVDKRLHAALLQQFKLRGANAK